jgi:multidrug efflux pump subunit AcrA (membrane-fusion protein)
MKRISNISVTLLVLCSATAYGQRSADTVVLDAKSVANLRIETTPLEKTTFADTLFALGRIEVVPANRAVVSTRISGRVVSLNVFPGDRITKGDVVAEIESRQAGFPPPRITLTAPIDGVVSHSHVQLGEPAEPDKELMGIVNLDRVYAIADIPEVQAARLLEGVRATVHVPAVPEATADTHLVRFAVEADRDSGSLGSFFIVENTDNAIRPGMRAEFSVEIARRDNVAALPHDAVQGDRANPFVFVKDFDLPNAFVKAQVTLGARNATHVEILGGVFPGDEVVTRGSYALSFAGGGSGISLKDALDAAHGHEHNEDGSEITAAQKAENARAEQTAKGGAVNSGPWVWFLGTLCVVQFALLILAQFARRGARAVTGGSDA